MMTAKTKKCKRAEALAAATPEANNPPSYNKIQWAITREDDNGQIVFSEAKGGEERVQTTRFFTRCRPMR